MSTTALGPINSPSTMVKQEVKRQLELDRLEKKKQNSEISKPEYAGQKLILSIPRTISNSEVQQIRRLKELSELEQKHQNGEISTSEYVTKKTVLTMLNIFSEVPKEAQEEIKRQIKLDKLEEKYQNGEISKFEYAVQKVFLGEPPACYTTTA